MLPGGAINFVAPPSRERTLVTAGEPQTQSRKEKVAFADTDEQQNEGSSLRLRMMGSCRCGRPPLSHVQSSDVYTRKFHGTRGAQSLLCR